MKITYKIEKNKGKKGEGQYTVSNELNKLLALWKNAR